ncbi:2-hydroxychromene-2-carboxylate isomerase [Thalassococcus sp. S3]|uniref:2-hydroxychromene-2-carboxylate isomerase n=1 Tax=Thalassococcus sp. S3 TaxID=2017482 RepID=UPI0010241AFB|nr:2-hydroxychromene-2-carboxylate isomerase [Thalassococcus sp. S3]QBF31918.1 disulfide bond formation protein DsbA [Thalassococcus sp. S3]
MQEIEFLYDFGSPNAYFVHKVLPGMAAKHGATLRYEPILLGGVFKATNNQPPMMAFGNVAGKVAYMRKEIERFIARYQVPFKMNPNFPVMTVALMRGAIYARGKDWENKYIDTVFDAMWRAEEKMDDPEVMHRVLANAGLPADKIAEAIQTQDIKGALIETTSKAVDRGVFGAPTMFVGEEMFFGKDALDDLDWWLGKG